MLSSGIQGSLPKALAYMTATVEDVRPVSSLERKMAALTHGPKMVQCLSETGFKWWLRPGFRIIIQEKEGTSLGRNIEGEVFDGKSLGE